VCCARQLPEPCPPYWIYKDLLAGKFGGTENAPSLSPVLAGRMNASIPRFKPIDWRTASSSFIFRARRMPGMLR